MEEVRNQIIEIFDDVMMHKGFKMEPKALKFWVNAVERGDKTTDDFRKFLLRNQDYVNLVKTTFVDIFYEVLSDQDYQPLYDAFVDANNEKQVDREMIYSFITASDVYFEKYSKIIINIYQALNGSTPTSDELDMFVDKFRSIKDYNIDMLKDDIERSLTNKHDVSPAADEASIQGPVPVPSDINLHAQEYLGNGVEGNLSDIETFVNAFEDVYGRNMNVREYLLYRQQLAKATDVSSTIQGLRTQHMEMFTKVRDVVYNYLGYQIDENYFIKNYLKDINTDNFLEELKVSIIASEEYEDKMKDRLHVLYKQLYDEDLKDMDQKYIFKKIKVEGFELMNEELNTFIVDFKNETDHIVERIFRIFIDVYDREPDVNEIEHFVAVYRDNLGVQQYEDIDVVIDKDLRSSLEYHDVIKRKIKDAYSKLKNAQILPSVIYSVLQKVIQVENKKDIDKYIESVIGSL